MSSVKSNCSPQRNRWGSWRLRLSLVFMDSVDTHIPGTLLSAVASMGVMWRNTQSLLTKGINCRSLGSWKSLSVFALCLPSWTAAWLRLLLSRREKTNVDDRTECVGKKKLDRNTKIWFLLASASANASCYLISFLTKNCVETPKNLQFRC